MNQGRKKIIHLKFRVVNRDIFNAIKNGRKKIETRAATERYQAIKIGDTARLSCGRLVFERKVTKRKIFKSIPALLKRYRPKDINPSCKTAGDIERVYYSFPKYKEKIKKYGIIALELK